MGIGYRVWGVGYWVVGIGYRVVGIFTFSNTLDARWVGGFVTFVIYHIIIETRRAHSARPA